MPIRQSDGNGEEHPIFKINRTVSAWQIGALVIALVVQATTSFISINSLAVKVADQSDQMKALAVANNQSILDRKDVSFDIKTLTQQVDLLTKKTDELARRMEAQTRK